MIDMETWEIAVCVAVPAGVWILIFCVKAYTDLVHESIKRDEEGRGY